MFSAKLKVFGKIRFERKRRNPDEEQQKRLKIDEYEVELYVEKFEYRVNGTYKRHSLLQTETNDVIDVLRSLWIKTWVERAGIEATSE